MTFVLAGADPLGHVVDAWAIKNADGWWMWSRVCGNMVLSALILMVVGTWAASKIKTGSKDQGAEAYVTRNKFAHMIEVICSYLREEVCRPLLGDRTDRMMPFLWTIFFFILVNNLLGLVPIGDILHIMHIETPWVGGTATQNFFVTLTLAVVTALVFNGAAIARLGIVGFLKHMTGGLPPIMAPIALLLFIIEAAGQFIIKPFALALRLFANMTAGHILVAVLFGFAGLGLSGGMSYAVGGSVTLLSCLATVAIYFLEIFVAFLQAFVFMFLTTVFISQLSHHHDHEHDEAHGHEHAHA